MDGAIRRSARRARARRLPGDGRGAGAQRRSAWRAARPGAAVAAGGTRAAVARVCGATSMGRRYSVAAGDARRRRMKTKIRILVDVVKTPIGPFAVAVDEAGRLCASGFVDAHPRMERQLQSY